MMGVVERLRRPEWLQEMRSLVTFVLVVLTVLGVVNIVALVTGDSIVATVPTRAVAGVAAAVGDLRPGATIDPNGTVDVLVSDPDAGQRIDAALTKVPTYVVTVIM